MGFKVLEDQNGCTSSNLGSSKILPLSTTIPTWKCLEMLAQGERVFCFSLLLQQIQILSVQGIPELKRLIYLLIPDRNFFQDLPSFTLNLSHILSMLFLFSCKFCVSNIFHEELLTFFISLKLAGPCNSWVFNILACLSHTN